MSFAGGILDLNHNTVWLVLTDESHETHDELLQSPIPLFWWPWDSKLDLHHQHNMCYEMAAWGTPPLASLPDQDELRVSKK